MYTPEDLFVRALDDIKEKFDMWTSILIKKMCEWKKKFC